MTMMNHNCSNSLQPYHHSTMTTIHLLCALMLREWNTISLMGVAPMLRDLALEQSKLLCLTMIVVRFSAHSIAPLYTRNIVYITFTHRKTSIDKRQRANGMCWLSEFTIQLKPSSSYAEEKVFNYGHRHKIMFITQYI